MKDSGGRLDTVIARAAGNRAGNRENRNRARTRLVAALMLTCALLVTACGGTTGIPEADGTDGGGLPMPGEIKPVTPPPNATTAPTPSPIDLITGAERTSPGVVASGGPNAPYNYAPSIMDTGSGEDMWWCSQLPGAPRPGDQILFAQAGNADGPFVAPGGGPGAQVFGNSPTGFDQLHTCDPSVVRVDGIYYLYYTGTSNAQGQDNAIGLALSTDGIHWSRANGGAPIVAPAGDTGGGNAYGAGQPSAVYLNGWFYLLFTDTSGKAADASGAGQFVLRSTTPTFTGGVQALGPTGFTSVASTKTPRLRSLLAANTADWMWVDSLNAFAIAADTAQGSTVSFWNADFTYQPYPPVSLPGAAQDGPGLVRTPDGHAPIPASNPCGSLSLDLVRATANRQAPTGLTHFGVTLTGFNGCQTPAQAADVLNGFAMPSPDRTMDLLVDGKFVDFERATVAQALAVGTLDQPVPALAGLPVEATINAQATGVSTGGQPIGLLATNGHLCLVGSSNAAQLNSSTVRNVDAAAWSAYPGGCDLSALRP
ncbi:MAG TPA: beta-xylosidase [Pseudonocardiaceae bacterium]